jgi:hypothetical protein
MPLKDHVEFDDFKKIITCGEFHLVTVGDTVGAPTALPPVAPTAGQVEITSLGDGSSIQLASDNLAVTCGATKLNMSEKSGIVFDSDEKFLTTLQVSNNEDVVFEMNKAGINLTFNVGANPAIFNMAKNLVSLNIGAKSSIIMTDQAITFSVGVDALVPGSGTKMELTPNGIVITAPSVEYNLTQQHKVTVGADGNNSISTLTPGKIAETVGQSNRELVATGHALAASENKIKVEATGIQALSASAVTISADVSLKENATMVKSGADAVLSLKAPMTKLN